MSKKVYVKEGRKYKELGPLDVWAGVPEEGVWLSLRESFCKSSFKFMNIGDVPKIMTQAAFARHTDKIAACISKSAGLSPFKVAQEIVRVVVEAEEHPEVEKEVKCQTCGWLFSKLTLELALVRPMGYTKGRLVTSCYKCDPNEMKFESIC